MGPGFGGWRLVPCGCDCDEKRGQDPESGHGYYHRLSPIGVPLAERVVAAIAIFKLLHFGVLQGDLGFAVHVEECKTLLVVGHEGAVLLLAMEWDHADFRVGYEGVGFLFDGGGSGWKWGGLLGAGGAGYREDEKGGVDS